MGQGEYLAARAQNIDRGVISSKVVAILQRDRGHPLAESDKRDLEAAHKLLSEILSGAQSVERPGHMAGVTARSIRSLGFAMSPLEKIRQISVGTDSHGQTVVRTISRMNEALKCVLDSHSVPEASNDLEMTRAFFEFLSESALSSLNRARKPIRGLRR